MSGKLFVVSASSGAGKTTLVKHSIERLRETHAIFRVVTYTTKAPREGEALEGVDYYFISPADFEKKIGEGFFLEWSCAYGDYYGTPKSLESDLAVGRSAVLIVDRAGAHRIKELMPGAILIRIYTQNIEVLRQRLLKRGCEFDRVEQRLALAVLETEEEATKKVYDFHVLNDDFCETLEKLCEIFNFFLKQSV